MQYSTLLIICTALKVARMDEDVASILCDAVTGHLFVSTCAIMAEKILISVKAASGSTVQFKVRQTTFVKCPPTSVPACRLC